MFPVLEVDNSGESLEDRFRGLREELALAKEQSPGALSGGCASNEAERDGLMLLVYDNGGAGECRRDAHSRAQRRPARGDRGTRAGGGGCGVLMPGVGRFMCASR
jgi:hypothetical protein